MNLDNDNRIVVRLNAADRKNFETITAALVGARLPGGLTALNPDVKITEVIRAALRLAVGALSVNAGAAGSN